MGLIAPPNYIAPPPIQGHRYGLYSVSTMRETNERWELGVEWERLAGIRAELRASECVDDYTPDVGIRPGEALDEGVPFFVTGSYACKSASRPIAEAEDRARLHLQAGEERAVELAISNPIVGNGPSFAGATDLTPVVGAVPLVNAVGLLENAQYEQSASVGAIHAPRFAGAIFAFDSLANRQAQHMETALGTHIAFGHYANLDPNGAAAGADEMWLYATGMPTVRRGETFTQPDDSNFLNRDDNDVVILAQRPVMVTWNGPTFAVLVDLSGYQPV